MSDDKSQSTESSEQNDLKFLLDSSYPLLKKFRESCPGTFKHCQNVASIVESISIALKLDPTFMQLCSIYHDIGKMINPYYFTENQLDNENPHNKLDPYMSYQIITRHISDTALILLNDENFPREIINIITQHHGSSVVKYFYKKSGTDIDDLYRYKSQKPTCIQSAILMICDCIEARSRSEVQAGSINPKNIIEETINDLMSDGQLDDVVMRLGDLQTIKDELAKELQGIYQKRVDYNKAIDQNKKGEN